MSLSFFCYKLLRLLSLINLKKFPFILPLPLKRRFNIYSPSDTFRTDECNENTKQFGNKIF